MQAAEDEVALLHARFDVRRAELESRGNELVGAIEAEQNVLTLDEAKQRLAQLEADVKRHRETTGASADGLREKRNKAQLSVQVAAAEYRESADARAVRRLHHGAHQLHGVRRHRVSAGMMPDYRVGDAAFAGQPIADVIDTSQH